MTMYGKMINFLLGVLDGKLTVPVFTKVIPDGQTDGHNLSID